MGTVQNKLADFVHIIDTNQHYSIDLLRELHWLPIHSQVTFKIGTLCYIALWHQQSTYLHDALHPYVPNHTLQSGSRQLGTVVSVPPLWH